MSRDSLSCHVRAGHVPVAIAVRATGEETHSAESLTSRAEFLWRRAESVLEAAEDLPNIELAAIRELRATVELLGRLVGAFSIEEKIPLTISLSLSDGTPLTPAPHPLPEGDSDDA